MANEDQLGSLAAQDQYGPLLPPPNAQPDPRFAQYLGISHLLDPATYQDQPPPSIIPNAQGKVPQSDPRVLGGLADLTNVAQTFMPVGGAAAGAKAAIPILGGLARGVAREAPAIENAVAQGIHAYHSSPYDFDRFDMSKIGTGEGAQVYGHGLYFAENPAVSGQGGQYWQQFLSRFSEPEISAAERFQKAGFDRAAAIAEINRRAGPINRLAARQVANPSEGGARFIERAANLQAQLDLLKSGKPVGPRTYEVNIAARPEQFLNWDKPLTPETVKPFQGKGLDYGTSLVRNASGWETAVPAGDTYKAMERKIGPAATSAVLNEAGIPGIRYLDQGSRVAQDKINLNREFMTRPHVSEEAIKAAQAEIDRLGSGITSNYVVFDPNIVTIKRKYAVPLAAGGTLGGLAAQDNYGQQ